MTDNTNSKWRSDLKEIQVVDDTHFIEVYPNGNTTNFKITKKELLKQYEFDMENKFFTGHWIGTFEKINEKETKMVFTEELHIKNPVMKVLSYLFMNLKRQQKLYMYDLEKELNK